MPPTNYGNGSPDIEETMLLAAIRRSMEDEPKSIQDQEKIIREKYRSLRGGSGGHKFDINSRNLNDMITLSRPQKEDEGPCMVLNNDDESGSDTIESQLEQARRSRASRSSSPDSKRLKSEINDNMIITPKFKTSRRHSNDDHMAGSPKTPQEAIVRYIVNDSDDDHMAGSPKTPQEGSIKYSGNDSDDESADSLNDIPQDCLEDDKVFCNFKNDCSKCYRNILLWVLLSCDMLLEKIREHKTKPSLPPCSEFDYFLLHFYDQCQTRQTISIDKEFSNSNEFPAQKCSSIKKVLAQD